MEIKEIWKTIEDYPDYMISNLGNVKSLNYGRTGKERILKQVIVCGYCQVSLSKDGKKKKYFVHRLVCSAFLPNPNNYPCVNHRDENKQNNCVSNLEFCTQKYNANYGTRNEKLSIANKGKKRTQEQITNHSSSVQIPIVQYGLNDKLIGIWESAKQVSEVLGIDNSSIAKCLKGKYKTCNGYKWKYLKDFLTELEKKAS